MLFMVLFKGHPGSGKSSTSRRLSRRLRWPVIDKDDSKDILMTQPGCPEERDANAFSYSIMLRTASTQLSCGLSVILDCPLAHLELYRRALTVAEKEGAVVVVVECVCKDHEVWKKRLLSRVDADAGTEKAHKPQTWTEIEAIFARYKGCDAWVREISPRPKCVVVDTSRGSPEDSCQAVVSYLQDLGLVEGSLSAEDPLFLSSG